MPNIKLCQTADNFHYTTGAELGKGLFGTVHAVNETLDGQALVCKTMQIQANPLMGQSRTVVLQYAINEINILSKVGMLAGYHYDAAQNELTILMHRAPGVTEKRTVGTVHEQNAKRAAFKAMRDLHRNGIAHHDAHHKNYVYDEATDTAIAVDFGLSAETNKLRELKDLLIFGVTRAVKIESGDEHNFSNMQHQKNINIKNVINDMINLYVEEMMDYAKNNKIKFAQDVFFMATVTIAAITGASVFGVAGLLAREFIRRSLKTGFATCMDMFAQNIATGRQNQENAPLPLKLIMGYWEMLFEVVAGMMLSADINSAYHHGTKAFESFAHIYETLSPMAKDFWIAAAENVSVEDLGIAMMGIAPLERAYKATAAFVERNILSESALVAWTDFNQYGGGNVKSVLWNFGKKAVDNAQAAIDYVLPAAPASGPSIS